MKEAKEESAGLGRERCMMLVHVSFRVWGGERNINRGSNRFRLLRNSGSAGSQSLSPPSLTPHPRFGRCAVEDECLSRGDSDADRGIVQRIDHELVGAWMPRPLPSQATPVTVLKHLHSCT